MKIISWVLFLVILFGFMNLSFVSGISIAVHVPEKYTDVGAGERFYFEIEVKYPENPLRKDLRLEYEILDKNRELIAQSKVLKAVEIQASFMDFIVIPENVNSGLYFIKVKISDYETLSEEVESSFQVISNSGEQIKVYFFILLFGILVVGGLVIINFFRIKKQMN